MGSSNSSKEVAKKILQYYQKYNNQKKYNTITKELVRTFVDKFLAVTLV